MKIDYFEGQFGKHDFPVVAGSGKEYAAVYKDGSVTFHDGETVHGFGVEKILHVRNNEDRFKELVVEAGSDGPEGDGPEGDGPAANQAEETPAQFAARLKAEQAAKKESN